MTRSADPDTHMFAEAAEAPDVVERLLSRNGELLAELGASLRSLGPRAVLTCARGSSDHAATYLKHLVETRAGEKDRRQRLLRLTDAGARLESELFEAARKRMAAAYARAGQQAVGGYWAVLEGMIPEDARAQVEKLRG